MDISNLLFGLMAAGIKSAARKAEEENPDKNTFVGALSRAINRVEERAGVYSAEFEDSYAESKDRFCYMSDYELKKEIDRLNSNHSGGYTRAGEVKAMREEIQRRRKERGE